MHPRQLEQNNDFDDKLVFMEPAKANLPIVKETDVIVAGRVRQGIAAAIASARPWG